MAAIEAVADVKVAPVVAESRRQMDSIYDAHPVLRPPPTREAARRLRETADSLENASLLNKAESQLVVHAQRLINCRDVISARAGLPKY